ncbi:NucA/NucB deoxyribonuclease domain-containing protein [Micromonospora sp. DT233]|uniref:NucA/NucB deoxyribonuclease domain-containing protein n=1 Tax=Micromonospora sp. DT233 TaxID=3393432 RepID=UPI003CF8A04D
MLSAYLRRHAMPVGGRRPRLRRRMVLVRIPSRSFRIDVACRRTAGNNDQGGNVFHRHLRRPGTGVAAIAVTLLTVAAPLSVPAYAAPEAGRQVADDAVLTIKTTVGIRGADLDRLRAQGQRSAGSQTPAPPAEPQPADHAPRYDQQQRVPALSLLDAQQEANRQIAAHPQPARPASKASMGTTAAAPIGEQPAAARVKECFDAGGADRGIGRIHNRFTYCAKIRLTAEYWEIDNKGIPIEKEGTTTANLEVFTQGDDKDRRVRVFSKIEEDSVDYDWGWFDNLFVAPNVPLSLIGHCSEEFEVCHASRGAATMPWATWDNYTRWVYWDVYNHEVVTEGRDKLSVNRWYVSAYTDSSQYHTIRPGNTAPRLVRCDSATYFQRFGTRYPKACIFTETIPHLTYDLVSDYTDVSLHIWTAQNDPNSTYPMLAPDGVPWPRDKNIPGKFFPGNNTAPSLHRITQELHPTLVQANSDHKNGACYGLPPYGHMYQLTGLPVPPNTPDEQCDEYPFASTLEGAGHPDPEHPDFNFSVDAVKQHDNSVAGGKLIAYYVDDRILAWDAGLDRPFEVNDKFYVNIRG